MINGKLKESQADRKKEGTRKRPAEEREEACCGELEKAAEEQGRNQAGHQRELASGNLGELEEKWKAAESQ